MRRKHTALIFALVACAVFILPAAPVFLGEPPKATAADTDVTLNFAELATHPQAAAEPVDWQRQITELTLFNGKLLAGYGDYNSNTGPVDINPFDIDTNSFEGVSVTFPTESIGNWKVINGKLYTTNIDARGCANCAIGYAVSADGSNWEVKSPITGLHIYDIETLTGTDLWLFGSSGPGEGEATVWRSLDDGDTWNEVETPATGGNRYYWGKALDGKMYFQAFDGMGYEIDDQDPVQIFDGTNWSTGTVDPVCYAGDYNGGPNPVVFDDKIVCYWTDHLRTFDGTTVTEVIPPTLTTTVTEPGSSRLFNGVAGDTKTTSDGYYMIDFSQQFDIEKPEQILRSPDLVRWQSLKGLPEKTTAMTIDEEHGKIYVGTFDAKLYVADLPAMPDNLPFPGEEEEEPPVDPDLNDDGTPDSEQTNVASLTNEATGKAIALELSDGCDVQSFDTADENALPAQDQEFHYNNGLIDFTADCGDPGATTTVKVFYYGVTETDASARKYDPRTETYALIEGATISTQTIDSQPVTIVSYQVTDGQSLDVDSEENGIIVDPVGLAAATNQTPNPTTTNQDSNTLAKSGDNNTIVYSFAAVLTVSLTLLAYFSPQRSKKYFTTHP